MNQNEEINRQAAEIPNEIKRLIKGLDSDVRLAVIVSLMKKGKMTFTELKSSLNINQSSLSSDLSLLQDGGLVSNVLEWNKKSYSYYIVTDLAKSTLKSLFDLMVKDPSTIEYELEKSPIHKVAKEYLWRYVLSSPATKGVTRYTIFSKDYVKDFAKFRDIYRSHPKQSEDYEEPIQIEVATTGN